MDLNSDRLDSRSMDSILALFDELDDVLFWIKDGAHRIIALNRTFAEHVKLPPVEILGKTDAELYHQELAQVFMEDDQRVLESGEPMRRKTELLTSRYSGVEWRATTKLPVIDAKKRVIGTTGISKPLPNSSDALPGPYRAFGQIVEYARANMSERITVQQIAEQAGMSIATLERRFRKHLRLSPRAFLAQMRLSMACKLLRDTPLNMEEIALESGYESPAAFSRAFSREMGLPPSRFRVEARA